MPPITSPTEHRVLNEIAVTIGIFNFFFVLPTITEKCLAVGCSRYERRSFGRDIYNAGEKSRADRDRDREIADSRFAERRERCVHLFIQLTTLWCSIYSVHHYKSIKHNE